MVTIEVGWHYHINSFMFMVFKFSIKEFFLTAGTTGLKKTTLLVFGIELGVGVSYYTW